MKLLYIGNKLTKHGYTPNVIETLGPLLETEGYKITYASDRKNQFVRLLDMVLKTLRHAPGSDFVLIDAYSTSNFYYALAVSQLCRLFSKKYIPILHGGKLPDRLVRNPRLSRLIFKNAYRNVAPSGYLLSAFEDRGYDNLIFIPNNLRIDDYRFHQRDLAPSLLWVRSFAGIYNPKMAIKVLALLQKDYPKASLCMVGPDKENIVADCRAFAESLGVQVEFTGKLSGEQWRELSESYSVFINTTHFDNTPVSVMEAMALGLPVVSTNVGGIPFLLTDNHNALLVPDDDTTAMAAAITRLLNEPDLAKTLTLNARALAESFDWQAVRKKWLEILS